MKAHSLSHPRTGESQLKIGGVERPQKIRKKENVLSGDWPWSREKKVLAGPLRVFLGDGL